MTQKSQISAWKWKIRASNQLPTPWNLDQLKSEWCWHQSWNHQVPGKKKKEPMRNNLLQRKNCYKHKSCLFSSNISMWGRIFFLMSLKKKSLKIGWMDMITNKEESKSQWSQTRLKPKWISLFVMTELISKFNSPENLLRIIPFGNLANHASWNVWSWADGRY